MAEERAESMLVEALREQEAAWEARPAVRRLYGEWYSSLVARLSPVEGASVELGSGIGKLRELAGDRVVLTDVEPTPWADRTVDALALPYEDGALANLVLLDVFHHLADPARFLDEAQRTLAPGGRVLMVEPYCSPVSTVLYRRFHQERTDLSVDPFAADEAIAGAAFDSNQALPTLAFFRRAEELARRWPGLELAERRRFAFLAYPLSGGFGGRRLAPDAVVGAVAAAERVLAPLAPVLAFRCLVVLEKRGES